MIIYSFQENVLRCAIADILFNQVFLGKLNQSILLNILIYYCCGDNIIFILDILHIYM